jgi:hypothetical protein
MQPAPQCPRDKCIGTYDAISVLHSQSKDENARTPMQLLLLQTVPKTVPALETC